MNKRTRRRVIRLLVVAGLGASLGTALEAADCNENAVADVLDLERGVSLDCNRNAIPDECDVVAVNVALSVRAEFTFRAQNALLAVDLDDDGAADLLTAGEPRRVQFRWNDGSGTFVEVLSSIFESVLQALTVADLEGDGDLDLVVATPTSIGTLANLGQRQFRIAESDFAPVGVRSVAAADLDGDRDADVAVASAFLLTLLEGDGEGGFTPIREFAIGGNPVAVLIVDVNGDRVLDVVTGNALGNITVLESRGDGAFAIRNYFAGQDVRSLTSADLDADGDVDLVSANGDGHVTVMLNAGDGTFLDSRSLATLISSSGVAPVDLDADGDLDLVVTDARDSVAILLQQRDARFGPAIRTGVGERMLFAATADFDGDGAVEVAVAHRSSAAVLSTGLVAHSSDCNGDLVPDECQLLVNDCNGNSFPDECDLAAGSPDCDGNGRPDECDPDCNGNSVPDDCDLATGTSGDCNDNGTPDECDVAAEVRFQLGPLELDISTFSLGLALRDLDRDGDLDLAAVRSRESVLIFDNDGAGRLSPPREIPTKVEAGMELIAISDVDADDDEDFLLLDASGNRVLLLLNDGRGGFGATFDTMRQTPLPRRRAKAAAAGDVDGDGDPDVVVVDLEGLILLRNNSRGEFAVETSILEILEPRTRRGAQLGDVDADGDLDLLLVSWEAPEIFTFRNDGLGSFRAGDGIGLEGVSGLGAEDLDGDGDLDLVALLADAAEPRVVFLINDGGGRFEETSTHSTGNVPTALALADIDGDDDLDAVVGEVSGEIFDPVSSLTFFLQVRPGRFAASGSLAVGPSQIPDAIAAGDLDGDLDADLMLAAAFECPVCDFDPFEFLYRIANETTTGSSADRNHNLVPDECEGAAFRRGDSNADGEIDLTDAVRVLEFLFLGADKLGCDDAGDADDNGELEATDAVTVLRFLFLGDPPPPLPGPPPNACGPDPDATGDPLGCASFDGCE